MTIKPRADLDLPAVMLAWRYSFGAKWTTVRTAMARGDRDLYTALFTATDRTITIRPHARQIRIGHWLSRHRDRPVEGYVIERGATKHAVRLWRVVNVAAAQRPSWLAHQITQTENIIAFYRQAGPGLRLKLSVCNDGREYGIETGTHCHLIGDELIDALKRRARRLDAERLKLRAPGVTVDAAGEPGRP
jgi:hypothetical protein